MKKKIIKNILSAFMMAFGFTVYGTIMFALGNSCGAANEREKAEHEWEKLKAIYPEIFNEEITR